jgi:hypothetical protein
MYNDQIEQMDLNDALADVSVRYGIDASDLNSGVSLDEAND